MAIVKVYAVRDRIDKVTKYATNEEKTSIENIVDYATNPVKTEKQLFQHVLNLKNVETAHEEMQETKNRWNKNGGILAYHFIQSFAPGEVTPEQAHNVGIEFAQKCFGEKYEVVIGTHLDQEHLHNHVVLNSVSFMDGKKYHSCPESYYNQIRKTNDEICHSHELSVIENPSRKGKHYAEWKAEKEGKPTIRSQIRTDIDEAIACSMTFGMLIDELKKRGYLVKQGDVKHMAIKPPFGVRPIRVSSLGIDYTEERLKQRIIENRSKSSIPVFAKNFQKKRYRTKHKLAKSRKKLHGFQALYVHYLYHLGLVKKRKAPKKHSAYLRSEVIKLDKYCRQYRFLVKNDIFNIENMNHFKQRSDDKRDITTCENIENDIENIKSNLEEIKRKEQKENELRSRSR